MASGNIASRSSPLVRQWQTDGLIAAGVEPEAVAQLILSICLGFVAHGSLTGDAEVQAHADALAALTTAHPAETDASGSGTPQVRVRETSHSASG